MITINEAAAIAAELDATFTVLYVQECVAARPLFDVMGIPLVPGESGKEWTGEAFIPYACPTGKNL